MKLLAVATLTAGLLAGSAASAAEIFSVQAWINNPGGAFTSASLATYLAEPATPSATFTWSGPINWSDTSAQNSGNVANQGTAFFTNNGANPTNFTDNAVYDPLHSTLTESQFLGSNLTINGDKYDTFYSITATYTSATNVSASVTHDDGFSIYSDGNALLLDPGETVAKTDNFTLLSGTHTIQMFYVSGNGTPSILNFTTPLTTTLLGGGIPEPTSWALMILGFGGVGVVLRRRNYRVLAAT